MTRAKLVSAFSAFLFLAMAMNAWADIPSKKMAFGFYGGWSYGTGDKFKWQYQGRVSDLVRLGFHLGAYVQYNLSRNFGLQVNATYQNALDTMRWYYSFPGEVFEERARFGIYSVSFNGVLTVAPWTMVQFFILGGGGFSTGKWLDFEGVYFHLNTSLGLKILALKSKPSPAIVAMGTFTYLFDPHKGYTPTANSLRFSLGLEF